MKISIVCTGNVARSAALGILLQDLRPDLDVESSAVGLKAKEGRRMARPMRDRMALVGYASEAESHRSRVLWENDLPDIVICTAPVHVKRIADRGAQGMKVIALDPPLRDPAFGGEAAYDEVFPLIQEAARRLAKEL